VQPSGSQTIEVRYPSDVGAARHAAKAAAEGLGLDPTASEEIALAVTELATNLLKHARAGRLLLTPLRAEEGPGLQIESQDQGPGIADLQQAMTDGYSTAGSLGTGLGAVNRLMDEFEITSRAGAGTHVLCRKWLRVHPGGFRPCPLEFGVATRPHPGFALNGDAFIVRRWGESALAGIIDGLGHGQFAHRAAQAARRYIENHYTQPLSQIFTGVARACYATRGVVMALALFDWGRDRLTFASVGNIEVRVFPRAERFAFPVQRGIVGLNAPKTAVTEHPWKPDSLLVLQSDGLRSQWSWEDFPGLPEHPAHVVAQRLLRDLARHQDDATVLVVGKARQ